MFAITATFLFLFTTNKPIMHTLTQYIRIKDDEKEKEDPFKELFDRVHPFASLSPELYYTFIINLEKFRDTHMEESLDLALDALEELSLYDSNGEFEEECYHIVQSIRSNIKK